MFTEIERYVNFIVDNKLSQRQNLFLYLVYVKRYDLMKKYLQAVPVPEGENKFLSKFELDDLITRGFIIKVGEGASVTKEGISQIPQFIRTKKGVHKIDKSVTSYTTGAGAIENYLAENPNSLIKDFILELIKYREICTRLNTFGETFIQKFKNPITRKVHTIFRQANTSTGRLQSGSKRKKEKKKKTEEVEGSENYFNSQNIPAEKEYRECFTVEEGYEVVSCDYSGCEAVVMIDKARDEKFYEFAIKNDDAHSPLCQAVWRAIGQYRKSLTSPQFEDYYKANALCNITVSKKENKDLRTDFKAMTFGVCYGMGMKKAAKTLRISEEEAKIAIKTQKGMLPKTFKYLDMVANQATNQGYVIINNRDAYRSSIRLNDRRCFSNK